MSASGQSTHWLAGALERLSELVAQPDSLSGHASHETMTRCARGLVADLSARPGVIAAFAECDGLLVDAFGKDVDLEAMAAIAQHVAWSADDGALLLGLGEVDQLVIVGKLRKLALFRAGAITVGVLGPRDVTLARALS